jgi:hypothetical protein
VDLSEGPLEVIGEVVGEGNEPQVESVPGHAHVWVRLGGEGMTNGGDQAASRVSSADCSLGETRDTTCRRWSRGGR